MQQSPSDEDATLASLFSTATPTAGTTATAPSSSTASARLLAADIPTPDDGNGPARAYVSSVAGAWRVVFAMAGGRREEPVGPAFPMDRAGARAARALSRALNERLGGKRR